MYSEYESSESLLVTSCALLSLVVDGETLFTESVTAPSSLSMKYGILLCHLDADRERWRWLRQYCTRFVYVYSFKIYCSPYYLVCIWIRLPVICLLQYALIVLHYIIITPYKGFSLNSAAWAKLLPLSAKTHFSNSRIPRPFARIGHSLWLKDMSLNANVHPRWAFGEDIRFSSAWFSILMGMQYSALGPAICVDWRPPSVPITSTTAPSISCPWPAVLGYLYKRISVRVHNNIYILDDQYNRSILCSPTRMYMYW